MRVDTPYITAITPSSPPPPCRCIRRWHTVWSKLTTMRSWFFLPQNGHHSTAALYVLATGSYCAHINYLISRLCFAYPIKAKALHNGAYNIGFVKVPRDMTNTSVLSPGPTVKGGFYNFGGFWTPQENKGVNWITDFKSIEENASRLKAIKLSDGKTILLLYEMWTGTKYVSSQFMTVDHNGKVTRGPSTAQVPFDLPFADELSITGANTAVFFAGAPGKLARFEISVKTAKNDDGAGAGAGETGFDGSLNTVGQSRIGMLFIITLVILAGMY